MNHIGKAQKNRISESKSAHPEEDFSNPGSLLPFQDPRQTPGRGMVAFKLNLLVLFVDLESAA